MTRGGRRRRWVTRAEAPVWSSLLCDAGANMTVAWRSQRGVRLSLMRTIKRAASGRVWSCLAVVFVLALASASAGRIRLQTVPGGASILQASDITYSCSYLVPANGFNGDWDLGYGSGLTVRYESSDATNQVHLMAVAYSPGGTAYSHPVVEWRDLNLGSGCSTGGGSPHDPASYTTIPSFSKFWGDIYSNGGTAKIKCHYMAALVDCGGSGVAVYLHALNNRVYWNYGIEYAAASDCPPTFSFGYSDTINYAAGTMVGHGPWGVSGTNYKSTKTGIMTIPSAWAAAHLSNKRIAIGAGGYSSIVADCDTSLGPSAIAVDEPVASERTQVTGTKLVNFAPTVGAPGRSHDRMTRVTSPSQIFTKYSTETWPVTKSSWHDYFDGMAWIQRNGKNGIVFAATLAEGMMHYTNAAIYAEAHNYYWAIHSEADFESVVRGAVPYSIQPTLTKITGGPEDFSAVPYALGSTITCDLSSVAGQARRTPGQATARCAGGHGGATAGQFVTCFPSPTSSEYYSGWNIDNVPDSTHFTFHNLSLPMGSNWAGTTVTSVTCRVAPNLGGHGIRLHGLTDDDTTGILYTLRPWRVSGSDYLIESRYQVN